jgi:hypothetical protein
MQPLSIDEAVLAIKRHQRFSERQQSGAPVARQLTRVNHRLVAA